MSTEHTVQFPGQTLGDAAVLPTATQIQFKFETQNSNKKHHHEHTQTPQITHKNTEKRYYLVTINDFEEQGFNLNVTMRRRD